MYTTRRTVAMYEARGAPSHAKECDTSCCLLGTIYILDVNLLPIYLDWTRMIYIPSSTLIHSAQLGDKQFGFTLIDCRKS